MSRRPARMLGVVWLAQALLWGLGLTSAGCAQRVGGGVSWSVVFGPTSVTVGREYRTVFEYRHKDVPFKPYVQLLYTPGGVNVLRDSPSDHRHHHGLMFAVSVDDVDFWSEDGLPGRQVKRELVYEGPGGAGGRALRETLDWLGSADQALLTEERSIQAHAGPGIDATLLTWRSRLAPPGRASATLSGAHYVGLGVRFVESLDRTATFLNASGQPGEIVRGDERVVRANWSACTGEVDGHPVTVAMFDHPSNARHPATWFTMRDPFAYMSATLNLWKEPLTINAGQSLELCYGVAVWDGRIEPAKIDAMYQQWLKLSERK